MTNDWLETIDLEVRIAAAMSMRERIHNRADRVESCVMGSLTDALISLRTQHIEKVQPAH